MQKVHYIAQISDTHLFGGKNQKINGANSYDHLRSVINHIVSLHNKPDLIVVSGDLSQDCTFESYQNLANLLNTSGIRYLVLPGNHDDVTMINKVFDFNWVKDSVDYSVDFYDWYLYLIDTSYYPEDYGTISREQFARFEKEIRVNKNKPAIVFMHHHPLKINSLWLDKMMLREGDEFNRIVKQNPQIKAVLFGHIHQVYEDNINGIFYGSSPATSYQILPNAEMFAIEKLIPGYRLIELQEDKISSKIIWVK